MDISINENCIYCHPRYVTKRNYSDDILVSGKRLNEIDKWLSKSDGAADFAVNVAIAIAVAAIAPTLTTASAPFAVAFTTKAEALWTRVVNGGFGGVAACAVGKLIKKDISVGQSLLNSVTDLTVSNIKIHYTFQYVQRNGNDGAFFLTDCTCNKVAQ
jgi:hypothetical protein